MLHLKKALIAGLLTTALFLTGVTGNAREVVRDPFIDWENLENPVLEYENWSIKDYAAAYRDGTFYVFYSAFYEDRGKTRSHVVEVTTKDWKTFSEPILHVDGREDGWTGMCSPNLTEAHGKYYLTFNSWGKKHPNEGTNDLFYMESEDLVNWSPYKRIAAEYTKDKTCIDVCILYENGKFYLFWKDDYLMGDDFRFKKTRLAVADNIDGPYELVGTGYPSLLMDYTRENGQHHENYCVFKSDGVWHMLTSDYGGPMRRGVWLYQLLGHPAADYSYLTWGNGYAFNLKRGDWNPDDKANASAIYDWREHDGYFYLLFAGSKDEDASGYEYAGRGWNRLGLARSRDLVHWVMAGE